MIRFLRRPFDNALQFFWGYDFFVSYAWDDGQDYPRQLHDELAGTYRVFLDSEGGFHAGDDLAFMTRRRVRASTYLVVVGRHHALTSAKWVPREAEHFLDRQAEIQSGRAPIIVNVNGAAEAALASAAEHKGVASHPDFRNWLWIDERQGHEPSAETLTKLDKGFDAVRAATRRLRGLQGALFLVSCLALFAAFQWSSATTAEGVAKDRLAQSYLTQAESARREHRANEVAAYAAAALEIKESHEARRLLVEAPPATKIAEFTRPGLSLTALAMSSRDGLIAAGDGGGRLYVLTFEDPLESGTIWEVQLGESDIYELAFSPNGQELAAADDRGGVWVIDLASGRPHVILEPASGDDDLKLPDMTYLADGRLLVDIDDADSTLRLIDRDRSPGPELVLPIDGYAISDLVAHPSEPIAGVLASSGAIYRIDAQDESTLRAELFVESIDKGAGLVTATATSLAFVPPPPFRHMSDMPSPPPYVAAGGSDASIRFFGADGALLKHEKYPRVGAGTLNDSVDVLLPGADGWRLLALRSNGVVMVMDRTVLRDAWRIERVLDPLPGASYRPADMVMACCGPDDRLATVAHPESGDVVLIWDLGSGLERWTTRLAGSLAQENASVVEVAFGPQGDIALAGLDNGQSILLDRRRRSVSAVGYGRHNEEAVSGLAFRPESTVPLAAITHRTGPLRFWLTESCTDRDVPDAVGESENLYAVGWQPDGRALVTAPFDLHGHATLRHNDVEEADDGFPRLAAGPKEIALDETMIERLLVVGRPPTVLAFSTHGQEIYSWPVGQPAFTKLSLAPGEQIQDLAATISGDIVLIATSNEISRWRLTSAGLVSSPGPVCASGDCTAWELAIDPAGRWFARASGRKIWIHDLEDGAQLAMLSAHQNDVEAIAASPSGDALISGGSDGSVILWELAPLFGERLSTVERQTSHAGTALGVGELMPVARSTPWRSTESVLFPQRFEGLERLRFDLASFASDERLEPICRKLGK